MDTNGFVGFNLFLDYQEDSTVFIWRHLEVFAHFCRGVSNTTNDRPDHYAPL